MPDLGLSIVEDIRQIMQVDDKWSVNIHRGFTWWSNQFAQHIWSDEGFDDDGFEIFRINIRTDVFKGFQATEKQLALLGVYMRFATMSGFVHNPEDPSRIQLATSIFAHKQTGDWVKSVLACAAPIQAIEATVMAENLGNVIDVDPDYSSHPKSGMRHEADDMLNFIEHIVAPLGQLPSNFIGDEMVQIKDMLDGPPCVMVSGDENGLTAEFPFPDGTSLLTIDTSQKNPRLGNGCLILLKLPLNLTETELNKTAMKYNELTQTQTFIGNLFGSWCPDESGLTYVTFLPNILYKEGALVNFAMWTIRNARWMTENVFQYSWDDNYQKTIDKKMELLNNLDITKLEAILRERFKR
jgi:hypothetical protein